MIPSANTDALLTSLKNRPLVVDFPQADHDDISNDLRYTGALRDFLR